MHITVLAVGTRGDVQPFVAVGSRLQAEGHRVRIASSDVHEAFVEGYGLEFANLGGNPQDLMRTQTGQKWLGSGQNPIKFWQEFYKLVDRTVAEGLADAEAACEGTDAIIYTFFGAAGMHMAEKLGVPRVFALLQPFTRTRAFAAPQIPPLLSSGAYNRLTYIVAEQMAWQMGRRWINRWRIQSLNLHPVSIRGPMRDLYRCGEPYLYGFSEHVVPRPLDWPAVHRISGYWFLNQAQNWEPPEALSDFLSSGPPPVYMGFGSMAGDVARRMLRLSLEAIGKTGQRAILLGGWAEAQRPERSDHILTLASAPHDWLFPRVSAVVHHGGAGTTAAGLRAGRPTLVVPFFADQPFWGRRVNDLGAGPPPLSPKKLTADHLARAIHQTATDPGMRARAAAVGEKIRGEDGVERAAEIILDQFTR
jgi:UDP:flavonoid glycosyltransferase YjiC (YdhE family)